MPRLGPLLVALSLTLAGESAAQAPPLPQSRPPPTAPETFSTGGIPPSPPADAGTVAPPEPHLGEARAGAGPESAPVPRPRPAPPHRATAPGAAAAAYPASEPTGAEPAADPCPRLTALGADFEVLPPVDDGGGCVVDVPLEVRHLGRNIALRPPGTMNCATAVSLVRWAQEDVADAAAMLPDQPELTAIRQNSTYVCRNRNDASTGTLSEHATANAVDVAGFEFDSQPAIAVAPHGGVEPEALFLSRVRKAACARFTTVLGPGSNPAHVGHFHFDNRQRTGGYRICELFRPPPKSTATTP